MKKIKKVQVGTDFNFWSIHFLTEGSQALPLAVRVTVAEPGVHPLRWRHPIYSEDRCNLPYSRRDRSYPHIHEG